MTAAVFTPLQRDHIDRAAEVFALGAVRRYAPVAHGSVNSIYRLETASGHYYLRLEERKTPAALQLEMDFLAFLVTQGFPAPKPIPLAKGTQGWFYILREAGDKALSVTAEVSGEVLPLEQYAASHYQQVGKLLGRFHQLSVLYPHTLPERFSPAIIESSFKRLRSALPQELATYVKGIEAEFAYQAPYDNQRQALPKGIVHGDLFNDNLFFVGGHLTALIDFEAAESREVLFDLATAVNALCFINGNFVWAFVQSLIKGYEEVRVLRAEEKKAWEFIWRLSSLRFTVTRIQDFYLREAGASRLITRDFRDFYARLTQQQQMSSDAFWQTIGA